MGNLHLADPAHALLARLLLVQELALAGHVAAVALGGHVLPECAHRLPGDDAAADRRLDRDLEQLARDQLLQAPAQRPAAGLGVAAVDDGGERVDRLAVDEHGHLDQLALGVAVELIVEAGVTAAHRFEPVVEVMDRLVQGQAVDHHGAAAGIGEVDLHAAPLLAQRQHRAQVVVRHQDGGLDPRLLDMVDPDRLGHVGGVVELQDPSVAQMDPVDDAGGGGDQVEAELALEALVDDLEMQQAQKAAAEAEAEGGRGLGLVDEARVIQGELRQALAKPLVIDRLGRKQAREHHRHGRLEAGQRPRRGPAVVGQGVAHLAVGDVLDAGGHEPDLAGAKRLDHLGLGREDADALGLVHRAGRHHLELHALGQPPVHDPDQDHHAQIGVVPAVHQERLQGLVGLAPGRRQAGDERLQHRLDPFAGLGRGEERGRGFEPGHLLDLLADALRLGGREVDLVQHRHDLVVVVQRGIDVGERLGLDPLAGVHHQQRALAGGQGPAHLVGEVDVAGRVHEVELIGLAVQGLVCQAHGLGLDGDAALALELHGVQHLVPEFALGQAPAAFDEPVGEGRLAVVDMGDDREIADVGEIGHGSQCLALALKLGPNIGASPASEKYGW